MGYVEGTTTYRVWDTQQCTIVLSRDVIFPDQSPPQIDETTVMAPLLQDPEQVGATIITVDDDEAADEPAPLPLELANIMPKPQSNPSERSVFHNNGTGVWQCLQSQSDRYVNDENMNQWETTKIQQNKTIDKPTSPMHLPTPPCPHRNPTKKQGIRVSGNSGSLR